MKTVVASRTWLVVLLCLAFCLPSHAQRRTAPEPQSRPKLVVGLVVDQMRWDYLYRYSDRYGSGGFKRMLREGFSAENTNIDYVPTVTAIGHATIYTGSVPSIHGIAGNNFFNNSTGEVMYCAGDDLVKTVGSDSKAGQMSPRNLLVSTVTDELKLATNFRSKVVGVAIKDRGSILPAGHSADAAYWFDAQSGGWISSTWYMQNLPAWVQTFNREQSVEKYLKDGWNTLYPISTYRQSSPDRNDFEGKFAGTEAAVFPIDTAKLYKEGGAGIIRSTPFGNTYTLDMAKAAVKNEALGKRDVTDFLAVSLSSTDYVGHQFGPNAIEVEDMYLRLDRDLAAFFNYLDTEIGKGQYTVFLSADHGAAHNATFLKDHKMAAGTLNFGAVQKALNSLLQEQFGEERLVTSLMNYQVWFNHKLIAEKKLDFSKIKQTVIRFLETQEGIAYAVDMEAVQTSTVPSVLRERITNGYNRHRSGGVQIVLQPAWYSSGAARPTGTTHSSWNPYDAHIPFVLMGWGIKPGQTSRPVNMTDVAPTLAALLKIQQPNGSIGVPVIEALK